MSLLAVQGGATGTGTVTILAPVTNTNRTLTLPDVTDTVAGIAATQTLTNKTLTSPVISSITNTGTLTLPTSTDTLVGRATTDTLTNKTLTSPTLTTPNINSAQFATVSGTAPIYPCRVWVNFNGTGTPAINGSGNVTSITDNGVGDYTINFTTAMPDVNYSTLFMAPSADLDFHAGVVNETKSTANTRITVSRLSYISSAYFDYSQINITIFR